MADPRKLPSALALEGREPAHRWSDGPRVPGGRHAALGRRGRPIRRRGPSRRHVFQPSACT